MNLCEQRIQQQFPLVSAEVWSAENPDLLQKLQPLERTLSTLEAARKYHREWSHAHKDKIREYSIRSRRRNAESIWAKRNTEEARKKAIEYQKNYRAQYPERFRACLRRSYEKYREQRAAHKKTPAQVARRLELYQINKEKRRAWARTWAKKPENRAKNRAYCLRRRKENVQYALADSLRATMNRAFRRNWLEKPARTEALIGCTIAEAKAHIEQQFVNGMSWQNRSSFVVDHFVPIARFDLRDSEEVHLAFNWQNLRPITRHENAVKSDTLPSPLPSWLPSHIASRILRRMSK